LAAFAAASGVTAGVPSAVAQIEEIVVTTRKRSENLQDVPIVVTAFTAASIERKGIVDLGDVAKYTSGLNLDEGFNKQDTRIVIRGLSPTRGRQNVAILQDEVDISSLAQATAGGSFVINPRLLDVERIEVVKGPHSALYGRSAFNGAVNYITKKPGDEFYGNAQLDVGTHEKGEARASLMGPVIDGRLSLGINASGWHFGGDYKSANTGIGLNGGDGYGFAGTAVFTPHDLLTFILRTEVSHDKFGPEARVNKFPTNAPLPSVALTVQNGLPAVIGAALAANPANATFPQAFGSLGNASDYPLPAPSRNPRTGTDYPGSIRDIWRTNLRAEFDMDFALLTSITHYGDNNTFQYNDQFAIGDFASTAISGGQETYFDTDIKLFSEEVRLQSQSDGDLKWTIGGLYWNEKLVQLNRATRCVSFSGGCAGVLAAVSGFHTPANLTGRKTYHYSAYGLAEYAVTEQLKASVELRYTHEHEDTTAFTTINQAFYGCPNVAGVGRITNANGTISCTPQTAAQTAAFQLNAQGQVIGPLTVRGPGGANDLLPGTIVVPSDFWAPRFTLDYKPNDDILVFASAALGKKPGGFSSLAAFPANVGGVQLPNAQQPNVYKPEEMWSYELGAKTEWMDGRLQVNGSVYYLDYSKKQVSITFVDPNSTPVPNQLATRVVNAAKARVKGFEVDIAAAPTETVSLSASYTYNDGKYKDFTDIQTGVSAISRAVVRNPNACTVIVVQGANRCQLNYSGYALEGAPKSSLTMGGEIRGELSGDWGWFVDADARYQSKRYTSFENSLVMDSYWLFDFRAGVQNDDWSVTAYVENAFDDDTMKASAVYIQPWQIAYLLSTGRTPIATQAPSAASGLLPDKRLFGVRASFNF
jgi:outer membrane receptor protein involved in Fe transport